MNDFDKYRILPRTPTYIEHREDCDTSVKIGNVKIDVPIISAGMHSIFTVKSSYEIMKAGGLFVYPRGVLQYLIEKNAYPMRDYIPYATNLDNAIRDAEYLSNSIFKNGILVIDIANGHMKRLSDKIRFIKRSFPDLSVWAGTVCTRDGVMELYQQGADAILVGIGVGEVCTTTTNTGVGLPPARTLEECAASLDVPVILAGGCRVPGDVVKAIALGANAVMSGSLFKHCVDIAEPGFYWGEASLKEKHKDEYVEGEFKRVTTSDETCAHVVKRIKEGLQSAMSYSDSKTIDEFRTKVQIVKI